VPLTVNEDEIRTLGAARKEYERIGQMLYGIHDGEHGEGVPRGSREVRRVLKARRRMIEDKYPEIRVEETDTYRIGSRDRDVYIPRIYINYSGIEGTGTVSFPSGARTQLTEQRFYNGESLRRILATLAFDGQIHPDETEVVISGSALPLTTFLDGLV
jgi:hypothetical protein